MLGAGGAMAETDFELLDRWGDGSREAGEELFARHFDVVHRFFRNKAGVDAADLVQATLLACIERRSTFRRESAFRTYLLGVARNILLRHFDARRRADAFDAMTHSVADLGITPTQLLGAKQHHKQLLAALRAIPIDLQALLELHYWEKLSGSELAAVLDVPEGTVRTRLRRAKQLLLEKLQASGESGRIETREEDLEQWAGEIRERLRAAPPGEA
jgi:RNA polymerase sigma factor (sigma-70 family)